MIDWKGPLRTRLEGEFPADLEEAVGEARQRWEEMPPGEVAERFYLEALFPLACERMRQAGAGRGPFELAFVPVGTQPFSPLLAALASPARTTVLVHTEQTRQEAGVVRESLSGERDEILLRTMGGGTDVERAVRIVEGEYAAAGFPDPLAVVVDLTGGRKAMSAALGSIASLRGFRLAYIEGQASRVHRGFVSGERFVELPRVDDLVGAGGRRVAVALLEAGAWTEAAARFRELLRSSGAGAADACLAAAARGWAAWEEGAWQRAASSFRKAARELPGTPAAEWLETLAGLARRAATGPAALRRWLAAGVALDALARRRPLLAGAAAAAGRLPRAARTPEGLRAAWRETPGPGELGLSRTVARNAGRPGRAVAELVRRLGPAAGAR